MFLMIWCEIKSRPTLRNQRRLKYVAEQLAKLPAWEAERAAACALVAEGEDGKDKDAAAPRPVVNVTAAPEDEAPAGTPKARRGGRKAA
jgi:hypothetical protein